MNSPLPIRSSRENTCGIGELLFLDASAMVSSVFFWVALRAALCLKMKRQKSFQTHAAKREFSRPARACGMSSAMGANVFLIVRETRQVERAGNVLVSNFTNQAESCLRIQRRSKVIDRWELAKF